MMEENKEGKMPVYEIYNNITNEKIGIFFNKSYADAIDNFLNNQKDGVYGIWISVDTPPEISTNENPNPVLTMTELFKFPVTNHYWGERKWSMQKITHWMKLPNKPK